MCVCVCVCVCVLCVCTYVPGNKSAVYCLLGFRTVLSLSLSLSLSTHFSSENSPSFRARTKCPCQLVTLSTCSRLVVGRNAKVAPAPPNVCS